MEFKETGFSIEKDLEKIEVIGEGRVASFAAKKRMGEKYRLYLLEPPYVPVAIFDDVPRDLFTTAFASRLLYVSDKTSSDFLKLAAICDDDCQFVGRVTPSAAIWASVLLARYCRNDFRLLHDNALAALNRISSANQGDTEFR